MIRDIGELGISIMDKNGNTIQIRIKELSEFKELIKKIENKIEEYKTVYAMADIIGHYETMRTLNEFVEFLESIVR